MPETIALDILKGERLTDEQVVERVLAGDTPLFEIVMRRYNQRLYRASRAILRDDTQAEDVVQDTYVRAYHYLRQFRSEAKFSTWLTRIALNEAMARVRHSKRYEDPNETEDEIGDRMDRFPSAALDPEQQASNSEMRHLLERWIDDLPLTYRTVFLLRDVEELSTTETAVVLDITEDNVKTRLHRARLLLRQRFYDQGKTVREEVFAFGSSRCDRIVKNVLARLDADRVSTPLRSRDL
jgi:RNA polymerase sigma-70 factor (ECF subfamily)